MPPTKPAPTRDIKDFFKPFLAKRRLSQDDVIGNETVVVASRPRPWGLPSTETWKDVLATDTHSIEQRRHELIKSECEPVHRNSASSSPLSSISTAHVAPQHQPGEPAHIGEDVTAATSSLSPLRTTAPKLPVFRQSSALPDLLTEPALAQRSHLPLTTSFSSISTLSSAPESTQSSSRRVTRDGLPAVTNSDSGSEDTDDDDLMDVSAFIPQKKRKLSPPSRLDREPLDTPKAVAAITRRSARLGERTPRVGILQLPPSPPRTVYKHSLAKLAEQSKRRANADAQVAEATAAFEAAQRRRDGESTRSNALEDGLKAAVSDDSDEGERMMLAVERTEALEEDEKFYFFRRVNSRARPQVLAKLKGPYKWLNDASKRTQACLTGFLAELVAYEPLPQEAGRWFVGELLSAESSSDLCNAYVEILKATSMHKDAYLPPRLCRCYDTCTSDSDDGRASQNEDDSLQPPSDTIPPGLSYIVRAMRHSTFPFNSEVTASNIFDLMLSNIDNNVMTDPGLRIEIEDTIAHVLEAVSDTDISKIYSQVHDKLLSSIFLSESLKSRAVVFLPASTARCSFLRRSLALHLFTKSIHAQTRPDLHCLPIDSDQWLHQIQIRLLETPTFSISDSTDYTFLRAQIEVLDIAMDSGLISRPHFQPPHSPLQHAPEQPPISTASRDFDLGIDRITSTLRSLASRIRDTGSAHLRRTEAKSAIERLVLRLEHSVRTRPKPQRGVFGGRVGQQRAFLSAFLDGKKSNGGGSDDDGDDAGDNDHAAGLPGGSLDPSRGDPKALDPVGV